MILNRLSASSETAQTSSATKGKNGERRFWNARLRRAKLERKRSAGFTLVEVMLAVGVLAVMSAIGVMAVNRNTERTREAKLQTDIVSLNEAVQVYLASGGDLSSASTPNEVLNKMKTVVANADAETSLNVLTGSMIDRRLVAEMQTLSEAGTSKARVYWNSTDQRFTMANTGGVGVKKFTFDDSLASVAIQTEARDPGVMEFSSTDGWVWDYRTDWGEDTRWTPSGIGTTPFPDPPPTPPTTAGSATAGTATAGTATAGTATAGTATAGSDDSGDDDGGDDDGGGGDDSGDDGTPPDPPRLPYPIVSPRGGGYLTSEYPKLITVANSAAYSGNGMLKYQLDGGAWLPYATGATIPADSVLRFQAIAIDPTAYKDSWSTYDYYYGVASSFNGHTVGYFSEVGGGPNLLFSLTETDTFLSHGSITIVLGGVEIEVGSANTMKFLSSTFSGILPGQEFLIGEILYHNGTTFDNSHATKSKLTVDVVFTSPVATETLPIQLELVNTENSSDPDASADYVKFKNANKKYNMSIDGANYEMSVVFGTTDVNGFSSASQFHVYEGATARGELRATITPK